jgi:hypothetical protein
MRCKLPNIIGLMTAGVLLLGAPALTSPAHAQATTALGGVGESQTVSLRAKVKSVNLKTRDVTLMKPTGELFTVHAGDSVQRLAEIKPGQTVVVRYYTSVAYVVSKANANTPENMALIAAARGEKTQLPGGIVAERTIVTGTVVGIDMSAHQLQLVNPTGGRIITIDVKDPQRQKDMAMLNVGERLTIVTTQALAIAIDPVK